MSTNDPSQPVIEGEKRSVSAMVKDIMDTRELNVNEVAEFLNRSPRMVRKLLRGESKGESFRPALEELDSKGTVTHTPERRRAKDGHVVPVRVKYDPDAEKRIDPKTGKELAPVAPPAPRDGRYTDRIPEEYRSRMWATKNGDKRIRVDMPPEDDHAARQGMDSLKKRFTNIARTQAHRNKQVKIEVTLDNGKKIEIFSKGGMHVSKLMKAVKDDFGGNMEGYIRGQVGKNIKSPPPKGGYKFASISIQTFEAAKQKRRM